MYRRDLRQNPRINAGERDAFENGIGFSGVKPLEIRQQISQRVAHLAIALARDLEKILVGADVVFVVDSCDPPTTDIGTEFFEQLFDVDGVAQRLGHLLALFVHNEPVRDQSLEWRPSRCRERGQQ